MRLLELAMALEYRTEFPSYAEEAEQSRVNCVQWYLQRHRALVELPTSRDGTPGSLDLGNSMDHLCVPYCEWERGGEWLLMSHPSLLVECLHDCHFIPISPPPVGKAQQITGNEIKLFGRYMTASWVPSLVTRS